MVNSTIKRNIKRFLVNFYVNSDFFLNSDINVKIKKHFIALISLTQTEMPKKTLLRIKKYSQP
jgi:hypothetical protein